MAAADGHANICRCQDQQVVDAVTTVHTGGSQPVAPHATLDITAVGGGEEEVEERDKEEEERGGGRTRRKKIEEEEEKEEEEEFYELMPANKSLLLKRKRLCFQGVAVSIYLAISPEAFIHKPHTFLTWQVCCHNEHM